MNGIRHGDFYALHALLMLWVSWLSILLDKGGFFVLLPKIQRGLFMVIFR
jgi:hypothetical protein